MRHKEIALLESKGLKGTSIFLSEFWSEKFLKDRWSSKYRFIMDVG